MFTFIILFYYFYLLLYYLFLEINIYFKTFNHPYFKDHDVAIVKEISLYIFRISSAGPQA